MHLAAATASLLERSACQLLMGKANRCCPGQSAMQQQKGITTTASAVSSLVSRIDRDHRTSSNDAKRKHGLSCTSPRCTSSKKNANQEQLKHVKHGDWTSKTSAPNPAALRLSKAQMDHTQKKCHVLRQVAVATLAQQ